MKIYDCITYVKRIFHWPYISCCLTELFKVLQWKCIILDDQKDDIQSATNYNRFIANLCKIWKSLLGLQRYENFNLPFQTVFTNLHTACFLYFVESFVSFYDLLIHSARSTSIFKDGWSELTPRVLYKRTTNRKQVKKIETSIIEFLVYIGYLVSFRFCQDI